METTNTFPQKVRRLFWACVTVLAVLTALVFGIADIFNITAWQSLGDIILVSICICVISWAMSTLEQHK